MTEEYDKLVRDDIPAIIEADGEQPVTERVEGAAYREALSAKLDEEVTEYHESGELSELADILEVVYALAAMEGVDRAALERRRAEKRQKRGGFDDGVVLKRVEQ